MVLGGAVVRCGFYCALWGMLKVDRKLRKTATQLGPHRPLGLSVRLGNSLLRVGRECANAAGGGPALLRFLVMKDNGRGSLRRAVCSRIDAVGFTKKAKVGLKKKESPGVEHTGRMPPDAGIRLFPKKKNG